MNPLEEISLEFWSDSDFSSSIKVWPNDVLIIRGVRVHTLNQSERIER
jgi:hypothetical protein